MAPIGNDRFGRIGRVDRCSPTAHTPSTVYCRLTRRRETRRPGPDLVRRRRCRRCGSRRSPSGCRGCRSPAGRRPHRRPLATHRGNRRYAWPSAPGGWGREQCASREQRGGSRCTRTCSVCLLCRMVPLTRSFFGCSQPTTVDSHCGRPRRLRRQATPSPPFVPVLVSMINAIRSILKEAISLVIAIITFRCARSVGCCSRRTVPVSVPARSAFVRPFDADGRRRAHR